MKQITRIKASVWSLPLVAGLVLTTTSADAQTDPIVEEVLAIRAKRIETASKGSIQNGIILIRDGKIAEVGKDVKIPVGAKVIQADIVMPGIVGAHSQIGLTAGPSVVPTLPPAIRGRFPGAFLGGGGARPGANAHFRVVDELYPYDEAYEGLLRAGVTTLGLLPGGRGITGQGAVVKPIQAAVDKVALVSNAPLSIHFASDTQTQQLIRTTLEGGRAGQGGPGGFGNEFGIPGFDTQPTGDEEDFQRRQRRVVPQGGRGAGPTPGAVSLMARRIPVQRAVNGDIPTFVNCTDAAATLYALKLLDAFEKLKAIYVLSPDSYRIADELGAKKASVILNADLTYEPSTRNRINPIAQLVKAGAKIACTPPTDNVAGYEGLRFKMAELIRGGLDRDTALKAITLHPAEMLGLAERVGSIEAGRDANLVFLDGDPFDPAAKITRVMLEGRSVYDGR